MNDAIKNQTPNGDWRRLLTAAERAAMLQDIAHVSLAAGAKLFPEQPWTDFGVSADTPALLKSPAEQLGFAEHLLPHLERAFRQIARSPLTSAAACTRLVRPETARRVTPAAWMCHARQSHSQPPLRETITQFSPNTPENRAIKSFLTVLMRDCRAITLIAEAEDEAEATGRALECARRLGQMAREDWWEEVAATRGDWALPPTQRGSLRLDYAAAFRLASQYRQGFRFDWDNPLLMLPPRETWQLYEVWCYLQVFRALRELGWNITPEQDVLAVRAGRMVLTLAAGEHSKMAMKSPQGQMLTLTYNRTFAEGDESLTHMMRPDITLSNDERAWVLDAKFKPYAEPGEEGEDINQMHAYRDAIIGSRGRSVACAWCLYAGLTGAGNRMQITYGRGADAPVGALCLRPGSPKAFSALRERLQQWLASAQ